MNALIIIILVIFASVIIMNVISPSAEVEPVVVKPKRKYKKRISKKNTIVTAVTKKPVGRPRKTVE